MKIYGRDHGRLVIENMFSQPVNVVPIVLMRCRQKLEEWKASQVRNIRRLLSKDTDTYSARMGEGMARTNSKDVLEEPRPPGN